MVFMKRLQVLELDPKSHEKNRHDSGELKEGGE